MNRWSFGHLQHQAVAYAVLRIIFFELFLFTLVAFESHCHYFYHLWSLRVELPWGGLCAVVDSI